MVVHFYPKNLQGSPTYFNKEPECEASVPKFVLLGGLDGWGDEVGVLIRHIPHLLQVQVQEVL